MTNNPWKKLTIDYCHYYYYYYYYYYYLKLSDYIHLSMNQHTAKNRVVKKEWMAAFVRFNWDTYLGVAQDVWVKAQETISLPTVTRLVLGHLDSPEMSTEATSTSRIRQSSFVLVTVTVMPVSLTANQDNAGSIHASSCQTFLNHFSVEVGSWVHSLSWWHLDSYRLRSS